jgi:hypothetical protein
MEQRPLAARMKPAGEILEPHPIAGDAHREGRAVCRLAPPVARAFRCADFARVFALIARVFAFRSVFSRAGARAPISPKYLLSLDFCGPAGEAPVSWFGLANAHPKRQSQPRNRVIGWMSAKFLCRGQFDALEKRHAGYQERSHSLKNRPCFSMVFGIRSANMR